MHKRSSFYSFYFTLWDEVLFWHVLCFCRKVYALNVVGQIPAELQNLTYLNNLYGIWLIYILKVYFFLNKSLSTIIHNNALFACKESVTISILYLANWFDDVSGTWCRIIWQVPSHHSLGNFPCSTCKNYISNFDCASFTSYHLICLNHIFVSENIARSLAINPLSGTLPKELGNLTNLISL